jgi:glycosyltransferase involved in cell wall biosynthesis
VAETFARSHPGLRVLRETRRGKGLAVRRGILAATGDYRFICDVDLSMPIEQVTRFLPPALMDAPIAIASREAPGAVRYDEPAHRHWVGRGFNLLVRLLAVPGLHDTQCGFKCFRADAAGSSSGSGLDG